MHIKRDILPGLVKEFTRDIPADRDGKRGLKGSRKPSIPQPSQLTESLLPPEILEPEEVVNVEQ